MEKKSSVKSIQILSVMVSMDGMMYNKFLLLLVPILRISMAESIVKFSKSLGNKISSYY